MRLKSRWVITAILLSAMLYGCSAPSASTPYPTPADTTLEPTDSGPSPVLTQTDKDRVIEIALSDSRVSEWLKDKSEYTVGEVSLFYVWDGGYATVEGTNSDIIPQDACIYPEVTISTGEEVIEQCQVFVDLLEERVIMVDGPYPSPGSPGRFSSR